MVHDTPPYKEKNYFKDLFNLIRKDKPKLIGISCMTPTFEKSCKVAESIKRNFNIPIVFGGIHPTAVPEETLKNYFVDYVIFGEGEHTIIELLEYFEGKRKLEDIKGLAYKENGKIKVNKPRELIEDLDSLPFPARHLFPSWYFQRWMVIRGLWLSGTNMMGSRGCPFNCSYCASKVMWGRRVRAYSPKRFVDEIEHLVKKYKVDSVRIVDDTFTVDKRKAIAICREIRRRKLKIKFRANIRTDTASEELVRELKKAGCIQAAFGIESGSNRILKVLNKGTTVENAVKTFKLFKKYKIRTCATFMVGNPTETYEDIKLTRKLAKQLDADYTQFFLTTPYPGTQMYDDCIKANPSFKEQPYSKYRHAGEKLTSMINCEIPQDELVKIQKELNAEFLKKSAISLFQNKMFIVDMLSLVIQRPSVIFKGLKNFIKTRRLVELYRAFYYDQNLRRF